MTLRSTLAVAALVLSPVSAGEKDTTWNDKTAGGRDPIIEVNGESITRQQLYEVVMRRYARQTLSEMVQRLLVEQEARRAGVKVSDDEIEARYREVRDRVIEDARRQGLSRGEDPGKLDPDRVFDAWVAKTYLGPEEFRHHLRTNLLSEAMVGRQVTVTDADLVTLKARVVTIAFQKHATKEETEKLAADAQQRLAGGADFASLARERSEDELARAGGALPEFQAGSVYLPLEPAAAAALLKLDIGKVSPVVKGSYGCYVLKLEARRTASDMDYITREEVRQRLVRERVEVGLSPWLQRLKKDARIEVKDKRFR